MATIRLNKRGNFTLPVEIRKKYNLGEGDVYTLIDKGDGSFILTPRISEVNRLGDKVAEILKKESIPLEEILNSLDEEREIFYREHYAEN